MLLILDDSPVAVHVKQGELQKQKACLAQGLCNSAANTQQADFLRHILLIKTDFPICHFCTVKFFHVKASENKTSLADNNNFPWVLPLTNSARKKNLDYFSCDLCGALIYLIYVINIPKPFPIKLLISAVSFDTFHAPFLLVDFD